MAKLCRRGNGIEDNINNLTKKIKELDPKAIDFSIQKSILFNPTKKYFNKVKKEETLIGLLLENLEKEKEILNRDNITIELECNNIREIIEKLNKTYDLLL